MQTSTCFMDDHSKWIGRHRTLWVLANEFPIGEYHILLVPDEHRERLLIEDLSSAVHFRRRFRDYIVFHNMRGAGASRPEHLHFQALPNNSQLPILIAPRRELLRTRGRFGATVFTIENYPAFSLLVQGSGKVDVSFEILQLLGDRPFNLLITHDGILIIPRGSERPDRFTSQFAALEMAGCLILVDRERFEHLPYEEAFDAIATCSVDAAVRTALVTSVIDALDRHF